MYRKSVEFLGHRVTADGIAPDRAKISAVVDWPIPMCVKDVRAFIGLAGYYRRFIAGFSTVAATLYDLTCKGNKFCGMKCVSEVSKS